MMEIPISELESIILPDFETETVSLLISFLQNMGTCHVTKQQQVEIIKLMEALCFDNLNQIEIQNVDDTAVLQLEPSSSISSTGPNRNEVLFSKSLIIHIPKCDGLLTHGRNETGNEL
jgi:hypothetical protein